jgi:imidazolonepropionase-like amidohydrolase
MTTQPDRVLITNATLVTCSGDLTERPFDGDILVEGDRIAGVFPGPAPVDPQSVLTVDAGGAHVLPGLCDAHVHISWPLNFVFDHTAILRMPEDEHALEVAGVVRTFLRSGYTMIIGAGAQKPRVDVLVHRAIERGLIDGPRLVPSGWMITQRGGLSTEILQNMHGPDDMRQVVAGQCEIGVRSIKLMASGDGIVPGFPSQGTYMDDAEVGAAVDEAAKYGAFVTAHARSTESVRIAARNGVRIIHHATFLDDEAITELAAARDDVWVCPGLHYLRQVVEGKAASYGVSRESVERAGYPEELQASIDGLRKLHSNGVRILAGGDFGHQWTMHGTYAAELASYVELLEFSPLEALLTATANAGPVLGEKLGRLQEGYLADLFLVDGDPTSDIRVLLDHDRIGPVVKGGVPASVPGWSGVSGWGRARGGATT